MLCNIHHRLNMLKVLIWDLPGYLPEYLSDYNISQDLTVAGEGLGLGTLQRTSIPHARPQLSFLSTSCTLRIWDMPEIVYL